MGRLTAFGLVGLLSCGAAYQCGSSIARSVESKIQPLISEFKEINDNPPQSFKVDKISGDLGKNGDGYLESIVLSHGGNYYTKVKLLAQVSRHGKRVPELSYTRDIEVGPYPRLKKMIEFLPVQTLEGDANHNSLDEFMVDFSFQTMDGVDLPGDFYVGLTPEVRRQYRAQLDTWRKFNDLPTKPCR